MSDELAEVILSLVRPELQRMAEEAAERGLDRFIPPPPEPWMTTKQVAAYLGLTEVAIRHRVKRGTLPGVRDEPSNRWIFRRSELDAYLSATVSRSINSQ